MQHLMAWQLNLQKELVKRVESRDPMELRVVAIRCVAGEREAYTGCYSKSINLDGLTASYTRIQRKTIAIDEVEPIGIDAMSE